MIRNLILRWWYRLIKKSPADMSMVSYWKTKESVQGKLTHDKSGALVMPLEGEKYPITCFPRGFLLSGSLSKLKHEIKNQVFNESWAKLEQGTPPQEIVRTLREKTYPYIFGLLKEMTLDLMPEHVMHGPVREIHRAWTKIARSENSRKWCEILCLILGEDDSYRFRVQWWAERFHRYAWLIPWAKRFKNAWKIIEHAEVMNDMKERERLWARIFMMLLEDENNREEFLAFCKEVNWKKLYMSEGDKYNFRGKYFRVDYETIEY